MADNQDLQSGQPVDIEIPVDIQVGFEPDGLPKTEPVVTAAKAAEAELVEDGVVEGEEKAPKPKAKAAPEPRYSDADYEAAQRAAQEVAQERDRLRQIAEQQYAARNEAERELQTRTFQALRAHWQAVNSHHEQIANAITSTKIESESAERDLATAYEAQDPARIAEANRRIATAAAHLTQLESGKVAAEGRVEEAKRAIEAAREAAAQPPQRERQPEPERREPQTREQPKQPQTPEDWIAQFPRKTTAAWLTEHKDYVTDPDKHRALLKFAADYQADYGNLHTRDFIEALNEKFFPGEEVETEEAEAPPVPKRKPATASAPVSRSTTPARASTGTGPDKVRLDPAMQDMAVRLYPDLPRSEALTRYASNLRKAQVENRFAPRE